MISPAQIFPPASPLEGLGGVKNALGAEKTDINQLNSDDLIEFENVFDVILSGSIESPQMPDVITGNTTDIVVSSDLPLTGKILPLDGKFRDQATLLSEVLINDDISNELNPEIVEGSLITANVDKTKGDLANTSYQGKSLQHIIDIKADVSKVQNNRPGNNIDNIAISDKDKAILDTDSSELMSNSQLMSEAKQKSPLLTTMFDTFSRHMQQSRLADRLSDKGDVKKISFDTSLYDSSLHSGLNSNLLEAKGSNQLSLSQPITNTNWSENFSDRVRWLISNQVQKAELTLNPRNLGSIEVSISLNNDQTNIQIVAQNAQSKDAVEASLSRLREMLDESGVNLGNVDVSQHSEHERASDDDKSYAVNHEIEAIDEEIIEQILPKNNGLIDLYA